MNFSFKTKPYTQQLTALNLSADVPAFALMMDMGTGKSKVIIDTAAYLYGLGLIDSVVVVAPNGVHMNWVLNEIPAHLPDHINCKAHWYEAGGSRKQKMKWTQMFVGDDYLRFFCFNVESASNKSGQNEMRTCVQNTNCLFVIDESQRIKTPGAKRTKFIVNLARHAKYRRILSGTPITQSPLDLYTQFKFLDPAITGFTTITAFRSHFAETELRRTKQGPTRGNPSGTFEQVVGYKNIRELEASVAPYSYRVKKEDCLDLPDKIYEKIYVQLTTEQKRVYKQLLDKSVAVLSEEAVDVPPELKGADPERLLLFYATSKVTAKNAMVKLLRLQQVLCGSLPDDEGNVTILDNRRMKTLEETLEDVQGKVIIWARFRYDLMMIAGMLLKNYGEDCLAEFHGGINKKDRMDGVHRFQNDPACRFFLAQQHSGGTGLTLTAATTVIYYSNDFSLEARLQSEDRAHRIGQKNNVTYIDFIAADTVDEKILEALEQKKATADSFDWNADTKCAQNKNPVTGATPGHTSNDAMLARFEEDSL